jgi:hypothetical protein
MVTDNNNVKENSKGKVRSFNSRPDGKNDRGGRWYPSETEECGCCQSIRKPSRSWPSSLYKHCTTKAHYLNLCKKFNADPVDLPGKPQKKKVDEMVGYKVCCVDDNGSLYSIYQRNHGQAYEWIPGKWVKEKVDHKSMLYGENPQSGLWYFDNIPDALMFVRENLDSANNFVLYECKCRYYQKYPSELYKGKYICSMIKLDKELYRDTVENICHRPLENIAYEINKGGN